MGGRGREEVLRLTIFDHYLKIKINKGKVRRKGREGERSEEGRGRRGGWRIIRFKLLVCFFFLGLVYKYWCLVGRFRSRRKSPIGNRNKRSSPLQVRIPSVSECGSNWKEGLRFPWSSRLRCLRDTPCHSGSVGAKLHQPL